MNQYNIIIYNDEERLEGTPQAIQKATVVVNAQDKDEARRLGHEIAMRMIPMCQYGIEIEFKKEL